MADEGMGGVVGHHFRVNILPIEVYKLFERTTVMRGLVLLINASIVPYMVYVRLMSRGDKRDPVSAQTWNAK
jgi:hypothetical protein